MKTQFLHDLDLARIASMSREGKRRALERLKPFVPKYDFRPMRHNIPDILHANSGALLPTPPLSWNVIEANILERCRKDREGEGPANIEAGRILYDFAEAANVFGRHRVIPSLPVGASHRATYWPQAVITLNGQDVMPYIDPRRGYPRLTGDARLFVFSVMQERCLTADLGNVQPCIIQLDSSSGSNTQRTVRVHFPDGQKLLGLREITAMVRETYEIWNEIIAERGNITRGADAGGPGPLI